MTERHPNLPELERLFDRQALSRRQFVAGLAALGLTASALEALVGTETPQPAEAQSALPHYFVLIVLDAFRADYVSLAPMPALNALARNGVSYDQAWVGQLESETPSGHATISTGAAPKHTGILGFEWRDPVTQQEVLDGWPKGVMSGALERDLRASGTDSIPLAVKAVDPASKVVAISSQKVYAADAMGGWAADYILHHQTSGPHRTLIPAGVPGHVPPPEFFAHPNLTLQPPFKHFTDWDYLSAMLALTAFAEFRPRVLMVNLPGADVYGHPYGGPATPAVMSQIVGGLDRNIDRIVQAYKQAGIFDQTLFVVTADHGMVPNDRSVPGDTTKAIVRQAGGQYFFHTGGTAADIYLRNPTAARAVANLMARAPGVEAAYFLTQLNGTYSYELDSTVGLDRDLDNAFRYLLATFAGPTAPDVVAPFRENTIGATFKNAHGDHGGLNWGAQHVPLVFSGPGLKRGTVSHYPARLMDVAPTVLRLLGIPFPAADGNVLADALATPAGGEVADQEALAPTLSAYQDAIIGRSLIDIAEDQKAGIKPPPSLQARP